jgi:hypothetical protein
MLAPVPELNRGAARLAGGLRPPGRRAVPPGICADSSVS